MFLLKLFWQAAVLLRDLVNDFLGKNCMQLAAAIAFYALFSLFPLVLALLAALAFLSGSGTMAPQLAREIGALIPVSSDVLSNTLEGLIRAPAVTGVFGVLGLLWASTVVFGAIRKGINAAWGIAQPRPFLQERLMDFSLLLGAGGLLLIPIVAAMVAPAVQQAGSLLFSADAFSGERLWGLGQSLVGSLLAFLTFLALYFYLPNTPVRLRVVWPGALLATAAFEVAEGVFVWYVEAYPFYEGVYGPIGWVVALLAFVYVSAVILLFGAVATAHWAAWVSARGGVETPERGRGSESAPAAPMKGR
ncbi:MAG: YihY/virulence factor BrkB family protein [Dehalococcoidia bacterium]|nr:YihY/virulence factor BrkB family protein [Dehalococcoidia bacterium]